MNPWQRREYSERLETGGISVSVPGYPEWAFTVRRRCAWNADYQRAVVRCSARPEAAELMAWQRENPGTAMPDKLAAIDAAMMREAFAEGCLIDWTVTGPDGKPFPPTLGNALLLFEKFPDIFVELSTAAGEAGRFAAPLPIAKKAKATAGN
jgi:hypothetical protein